MSDIYVDSRGKEWEYLCQVWSEEADIGTYFPVLRKRELHDPRSPSCVVITKAENPANRNTAMIDAQGMRYVRKVP